MNWEDIAKGNQRAYAEAYTFYFKKLFNYGRKFTEDELLIEDTIQEVLIILWNQREKLPSIQSPQSYLFYSFRNALIYKLKQQKKRNAKEGSVVSEPEFHAEDIIIQSENEEELKQKLEEVIQALPSRQREALFLRFYEKLSYEEMAEVMKISLHAAYKTVSKAIIKMRDLMGAQVGIILIMLSSIKM